MDKQAVFSALDGALITEAEFAEATSDKKKFDAWVKSLREESKASGKPFKDLISDLEEGEVRAATGGLVSAFERFMGLADPFFDGEAAERYMELDSDDDDGDDDSEEEEEEEESEEEKAE